MSGPIQGRIRPHTEDLPGGKARCSRCGMIRTVSQNKERRAKQGTLCRSCRTTMSTKEIEAWETPKAHRPAA